MTDELLSYLFAVFWIAFALLVVLGAIAGWVLAYTIAPDAINMALGCSIAAPFIVPVAWLVTLEMIG